MTHITHITVHKKGMNGHYKQIVVNRRFILIRQFVKRKLIEESQMCYMLKIRASSFAGSIDISGLIKSPP